MYLEDLSDIRADKDVSESCVFDWPDRPPDTLPPDYPPLDPPDCYPYCEFEDWPPFPIIPPSPIDPPPGIPPGAINHGVFVSLQGFHSSFANNLNATANVDGISKTLNDFGIVTPEINGTGFSPIPTGVAFWYINPTISASYQLTVDLVQVGDYVGGNVINIKIVMSMSDALPHPYGFQLTRLDTTTLTIESGTYPEFGGTRTMEMWYDKITGNVWSVP